MIANIVNAIRNNLLVCFPTETVYALACNALSNEAIRKIYQIKKRPQNKPLSIFVSDVNNLIKMARVKEEHVDLVNCFSPGPVTYILPLRDNRPLSKPVCGEKFLEKIQASTAEYLNVFEECRQTVTTKLPSEIKLRKRYNNTLPSEFFKTSVGIRIPNHPIAVSILNELEIPIIATSINISGEKSVCKANDIPQSIKQHLSFIIEDDKLVSGVESTIVDLTTDEIRIIRQGLQAIIYEKSNRAQSSQKEVNG